MKNPLIDRFYIPTRYPNGLPGGVPYKHFTKEDFDKALEDTETVMTLSQQFLKEKGVEL